MKYFTDTIELDFDETWWQPITAKDIENNVLEKVFDVEVGLMAVKTVYGHVSNVNKTFNLFS